MKVNKISMNSGKAHIVTSLALIGVCLIGIAKFMADGKWAVAELWFPAILIIGVWGFLKGVKIYKVSGRKGQGHERE